MPLYESVFCMSSTGVYDALEICFFSFLGVTATPRRHHWKRQRPKEKTRWRQSPRFRRLLSVKKRKEPVEAGNFRSAEGQLATCCTDRFQSSGTRPVFLLEEFLDGASIPLRDHVGPQLHEVWPQTQLLQQGVSVHPAGGEGSHLVNISGNKTCCCCCCC